MRRAPPAGPTLAELNNTAELRVFVLRLLQGRLYHLWVEAIVREFPNEGQLVGPRLLHQVLLHSLHGLEVVLQQAARHTEEQIRGGSSGTERNDDSTFAKKKKFPP